MMSLSQSAFRKNILNQVKEILCTELSGQEARAYLFGSWARGEEKRSSDMDVAIEFERDDPLNQRVLSALRHTLSESTIPYKVDIVDLNNADDTIVNKVRKEGILWDDLPSE